MVSPVKKVLFIIFFMCLLISLPAQTRYTYPYVKTWKVTPLFGEPDSIQVDTLALNFQDNDPVNRFSISNSYNGNLGSPIQSKLYFDRPENRDFIFSNAYYPYIADLDHATFYNTKTPYSNLNYITGGTTHRSEDDFRFLFTANANKQLNLGITLDYMYAPGEYANQSVQRFAGSLFGTYDGKHYKATGLLTTNNLSNYESGGLSNPAGGIDPSVIATLYLPVNITGYSNYKYNLLYYHHEYSVGIERPVRINPDSVRMDYVPVTRFAHTFKLEDARKRYYEPGVETTFYQNTYGFGSVTNDSTALLTMTNNFSVSMAEEFNKWLKFGVRAFVENEVQRYLFVKDNVLNAKYYSNTKIGGVLSKERGKQFRYNLLGDVTLVGFKAGDFLLSADLSGNFRISKDTIRLQADGFARSDEPSLFLQHYESNHFRWDNNFGKIYRTHLGGTLSIPTRLFSLGVKVENITRYIYFNSQALPVQDNGNVQVLMAELGKDFHIGKFALENKVVYQLSSNQQVIPLPSLVLFNNLYYRDLWFKVLTVQLGLNLRYHTLYYGPDYMPATGQFYNQTTEKIGNYPLMNLYANFHLKQVRFFIEYYNIGQLSMKDGYYSMPAYPLDPALLKLGISWNFYN